ncbi:MAG: YitT family protein [Mycoplasmatales bacterium]
MKRLKDVYVIKDLDIYSLIMILFGNILIVLGINIFLTPVGLFPTGFTGISYELSLIVKHFFNITIPYNYIVLFLNIPILIFGYYKIGNKFVKKTIISVIIFTIIASIIPSNLDIMAIESSGDKLISSIISGLLNGVGIGLLLKVASSSGGTDIVAVYISIFKGKSFGVYSLLINIVVVFVSLLMTRDIIVAALSLINLYVINTVIDVIHNSQEKRLLLIITTKPDELTTEIYKHMYRGITIIDSIGGYSKQKNNTLVMSVSNGEIQQAINLIKSIDERAFINVLKADKVVGNFENPYQKML